MIELIEKEPSTSRKVKNVVAKCLTFNVLSRGDKVWKRLNDLLPAIGEQITEKRIKKFQEEIKHLSFIDYYAIKIWLKHRYKEMEDLGYGLITGSQERYSEKWMQIYSAHYNAME